MITFSSMCRCVPAIAICVIAVSLVAASCSASISDSEREEFKRIIAAASKSAPTDSAPFQTQQEFAMEILGLRKRVAATRDLLLVYDWLNAPGLGLLDEGITSEGDESHRNQLISMTLRASDAAWKAGVVVRYEGTTGQGMRYEYMVNLIKVYVPQVTAADLTTHEARVRLAPRFEKAAGIRPYMPADSGATFGGAGEGKGPASRGTTKGGGERSPVARVNEPAATGASEPAKWARGVIALIGSVFAALCIWAALRRAKSRGNGV